MKQRHTGYYYIFNSSNQTEKIIKLSNQTFTDIDLFADNDDCYPLGSYLSGFMEVAPDVCIMSNEDSVFDYCQQCIKHRIDYLPYTDAIYVINLQTILYHCVNNMKQDSDIQTKLGTIKNLCSYVDLCADIADQYYKEKEKQSDSDKPYKYEDGIKLLQTKIKKYYSMDTLTQYASINNLIFNHGYLFTIPCSKEKLKLNIRYDEAAKYIEKYKLDSKISKLPQIQIYELNELSDLMLASLQVIFGQGKYIRECQNCYRYFVTQNRKDQKYCNYIAINKEMDCKEQIYEWNRENKFKDGKIKEIYDVIRKRLFVRLNNTTNLSDDERKLREKQYNQFLDDFNMLSKKVRSHYKYADGYRGRLYDESELKQWLIQKEKETHTNKCYTKKGKGSGFLR